MKKSLNKLDLENRSPNYKIQVLILSIIITYLTSVGFVFCVTSYFEIFFLWKYTFWAFGSFFIISFLHEMYMLLNDQS